MDTRTLTLAEFLLARIAEDKAYARSDECGYYQDPGRLLAECEAKRRIVEEHDLTGMQACPSCGVAGGCPTLRALAAVYADHADYRQEWRP